MNYGVPNLSGVILAIPPALFFTLSIHRLIGIKRQWRYRVILLVCCMIASTVPIYIGDATNILSALPAFFLGVWICCEGNGVTRSSMVIILYPIAMSVSAMVDATWRSPHLWESIIKTAVWLVIWLVIRHLLPKELPELRLHLWALIDILAALPLLTVICTVALGDYAWGLKLSEWILLPICMVVSIALLFAVVLLTRQEKVEREHRLLQMRNLYYENLEREQWQVRRLRHDMANHLQTMAALDDAAARKYLQNLIESPGMNLSTRFCDNDVANTVLCSKAAHMEKLGIRFDYHVEIPSSLPMKDLDLCAILANSLDNAIEACAKLPGEQRVITLDAAVNTGVFALEVRNPAPAPPRTISGQIISDKRDRLRHGFGLAGMREIAERYGAALEYGQEAGGFFLRFFILTDKNGPAA